LSNEIPKIYRKASKDIDIWSTARDKEEPMKVRARELAIAQNWKCFGYRISRRWI
jgi:hypothetical protein